MTGKYWGAPIASRAPVRGNAELEAAKTELRKRGQIVYDAPVTGGPRGYVMVDGKLLTRPEVIALARAH